MSAENALKPVLVFGAGGHALSVMDTVASEGRYRIAGLLADNLPAGSMAHGHSVLGGLEDHQAIALLARYKAVIVAVGDNYQRERITHRIRALDNSTSFVSTIHPSAVISRSARIGDGVVVMAKAVVNAGAVIGNGCLLNTGANVDHECVLGDYASVAPGATLGGKVRLGERSAIGLGAAVIHEICIGADTVVGAGSVVVADLPCNTVAYGNPCRPVGNRAADSPYL